MKLKLKLKSRPSLLRLEDLVKQRCLLVFAVETEDVLQAWALPIENNIGVGGFDLALAANPLTYVPLVVSFPPLRLVLSWSTFTPRMETFGSKVKNLSSLNSIFLKKKLKLLQLLCFSASLLLDFPNFAASLLLCFSASKIQKKIKHAHFTCIYSRSIIRGG